MSFSTFDEYNKDVFSLIGQGVYYPPTLYHYTSSNGLLGILGSNSLWCTNIYYLNDLSELIVSKFVIEDSIKKKKGLFNDTQFDDIIERAYSNLFESNLNIYVLSLSENGDLLSQWRAYSDNGNGFSIGFLPDNLHNMVTSDLQSTFIRKIIYKPDDQFDLARRVIDITYEHYKKSEISSDNMEKMSNFIMNVSISFLEIMILFKHFSFAEEKEWRIVKVFFGETPDNLISFRAGHCKIIPYLNLYMNGTDNIKIYEAIIGPMLNKEITENAIKMLMKKYNNIDTIIKSSIIPLCL